MTGRLARAVMTRPQTQAPIVMHQGQGQLLRYRLRHQGQHERRVGQVHARGQCHKQVQGHGGHILKLCLVAARHATTEEPCRMVRSAK